MSHCRLVCVALRFLCLENILFSSKMAHCLRETVQTQRVLRRLHVRTKEGPKHKGFQSARRGQPLPKLPKRVCNVRLDFHVRNNSLTLPCQPHPRQRRTLWSNDTLPYRIEPSTRAYRTEPVRRRRTDSFHASPSRWFDSSQSIIRECISPMLDGILPVHKHETSGQALRYMAPTVPAKATGAFRREVPGMGDHTPSRSPSP